MKAIKKSLKYATFYLFRPLIIDLGIFLAILPCIIFSQSLPSTTILKSYTAHPKNNIIFSRICDTLLHSTHVGTYFSVTTIFACALATTHSTKKLAYFYITWHIKKEIQCLQHCTSHTIYIAILVYS